MASVVMIGKHTPHHQERSAEIIQRNIDHIKLMIDKYNWQDFDISQAHTIVTEYE